MRYNGNAIESGEYATNSYGSLLQEPKRYSCSVRIIS